MHHHSWKILWQLKIRTTSLGQQTARHTKHHLNQLITSLTIPLSSCTTAFWTSAKFWMQTVGLQADSSTVRGVWRVHSATWPNQQQFGAGSSGGHGLGHSLAKNSSSSHVFSENPQRSRGTQESTVCTGPWTLIRQLMHEQQVAFPRPPGTKEAVGTRNLTNTSPTARNFTKSQHIYPIHGTVFPVYDRWSEFSLSCPS